MDGRDSGKPGVRRDECVSTRRPGRRGQNGVEGAEFRSFLVQAEPFAQIGFLDDEQRRQQLDVVAGKFCGVFAVTTASADVSEFLDDLDSGGRQDRSARYCADQLLASARATGDRRRPHRPGPSHQGRSRVDVREKLVQFGEQIANLHRRRIEDAAGRGGSPPLRRRQATVKRLPDHGGDRGTALPRERADPLVALIVEKDLQPVRQHTHTLACAYGVALTALRLCVRLLYPPGRRPLSFFPVTDGLSRAAAGNVCPVRTRKTRDSSHASPCRLRALAGGTLVAGIGAPIVRFCMVSAGLDLG